MTTRLAARHVTTYRYQEPALQCQNHVRLTPRHSPRQQVIESSLEIDPEPEPVRTHIDYFGNVVQSFRVNREHTKLVIIATSVADLTPLPPIEFAATPPWERLQGLIEDDHSDESFEAAQFLYDSPRIRRSATLAEFARPIFTPKRPVLEAALELSRRVYKEFKYDAESTDVDTPVEAALARRTGVCQDFAHVMAGCLRSLGVPARYVSGYLKSSPKFVGTEASHAWVSVFCPGLGWVDFDPTNNLVPSVDHVTLAWGRDYGDVPPVKGITLGGGEQEIEVGVGVTQEP